MADILLTEEEAKGAVDKWLAEDFSSRVISLSRGNWEQIVPVIARAQAKKLVGWLDRKWPWLVEEDWITLLEEVGLEKEGR